MAGHPISPHDALADTSFLLAVIGRHDEQHRKAQEFYENFKGRILIPKVTLPELAYLISDAANTAKVVEVFRAFRASRVEFLDLEDADFERALDILDRYRDSRIDFVDACIMATAERLNITRILTFDHRDFGMYRPAHCDYFELLP